MPKRDPRLARPPKAKRKVKAGKRVTESEVAAMLTAAMRDTSLEAISAATGIAYRTVRKYWHKGDPRRKIPPVKTQYEIAHKWAQERERQEAADVIHRNLIMSRRVLNAIFRKMLTELPDGSQQLEVPDEFMTPQAMIAFSKHEINLNTLHEHAKSEARAREGQRRIIVELSDPRVQRALTQKVKEWSAKMAGAGVRETIQALQQAGMQDVIDMLPLPLQIIALTDPEDPHYKQQINALVRKVSGASELDAKTVIDVESKDVLSEQPDMEPESHE